MFHLCNGIRNERFNLWAIIADVNDPRMHKVLRLLLLTIAFRLFLQTNGINVVYLFCIQSGMDGGLETIRS